MIFISGSDELSKIDIVVFPKIYKKIDKLEKDDIIKVKGKIEKRYDEYQLVASSIIKLK